MTKNSPFLGATAPGATLEVFSAGQNAYVHPGRFVNMLDLWGERILSLGADDASQMHRNLEALMEDAAPQMVAAGAAQLLAADLEDRLAEERRPAAAFTAAGVAIAVNAAASQNLSMTAGARLADMLFHEDDRTRFADFLRRARENDCAPDLHAVITLLTADGRSALAELTAGRAADTGETLVLLKGLDLSVSPAAFDALAQVYELTEAETLIAELTSDGLNVAEIAARRRTSVETVRTQIKSLREKTGTRTQMDLLRTIAGLAPLSPAADAGRRAAPGAYGMPRRHALVELPNGRRMEYARIGPANGRPIMVLHAVLFGFSWPEALTRKLNDAGFTLWLPVRPGYGMSSCADPAASFDDEAADLAEFADVMGLDEYCVVGQGVSAGTAVALSVRHHNRVSGMANVAGYLPMGIEDFHADMSNWQRTVLNVARVAPRLMKTTSLIASRMMRMIGTQEFFAKTFSNSAADMAVTRDPESLRLLDSNLQLLQAQQLSGLITDFPRVMADWQSQWEQLRTPGLQIHGGQKQVFAPEQASALCARHPTMRFESINDGGQMLAYSHPERVADLLIEHFSRARL
jgi:pimeloyl-ACP methyl ester carboxylesterase/DNA-binding CsgD family transcriptional regulator